ncbi:MAG: glycosyltransferase family 2 protein [Bryobacteraceae bacterium]|nr:glycosyltransferase family 2 protein [Bryobacteraceae bacterium]
MSQTYHRLQARGPLSLLSIVIPVYNEEAMLPLLRRAMTQFMDGVPFGVQLLLVNDGSSDASIMGLAAWAQADSRVKVIALARNFGHQIAVTAGLDYATGDAVVVLDADLQDPPEVILEMVERYRQGYDVVFGVREARAGESLFKRASAWAFYRLMRLLVHEDLPADAGDFRLLSRRCLDALRAMRETHRFLRGMGAWVGFPQIEVRYQRAARAAGETKYPLHKMLKLAWTAALSFSPAPLRISFLLGLALFVIGISQAANAFFRAIFGLPMVPGWASLMVVICLVGGGILVSIGVLGEYVARIFEEVKGRPLYLVSDTINLPRSADTPSVHQDLIRMQQEVL